MVSDHGNELGGKKVVKVDVLRAEKNTTRAVILTLGWDGGLGKGKLLAKYVPDVSLVHRLLWTDHHRSDVRHYLHRR